MGRMKMPPQNPRLNFVINDFSGGMVNNVNDVKMRDNQSPDMLNMQFRIDGLIQKRPGTVHVESTPWGQKLNAVIPFEYEPNQQALVYVTDHLMSFSDSNGEPWAIWYTNGVVPEFIHYMGQLFWVDGVNLWSFDYKEKKTFKYVNPPEDFVPAPKPAVVGVEKDKFISYYDNGHIECSALHEKWYEPCEYEMEDGFKGANLLPPMVSMIAIKDDRLYLSGNTLDPNMVYISEILTPSYFPASLPIQTPPTDDMITALEVFDNALIIGRRDSLYSLRGNTNRSDSIEQYVLAQINCHTGIANRNSADSVHGMMFFVGSDSNFYKLKSPNTNAITLSTSQLNIMLDLTLPPFNLTAGDVSHAHTFFDSTNGLWYVQLADITLVYNYQLMAWTRYDKIDALNFFNYYNELHLTRRTGSIYRFASREGNQQYYDEYYDPDIEEVIKLPVVAYWTSRNMDLGSPARVKQFRDTYVTSECFDDYQTTVNVKFEIDYVDIYDTFIIKNEVSKWNSAIFDESKFVSRNIDRSLPMMLNRRGRTIKVYYGCGYEYWGARETLPVPGIIPEYHMVYVKSEKQLYVRVPRRGDFCDKYKKYFRPLDPSEMNQALLVHNVMGIYEQKGYR